MIDFNAKTRFQLDKATAAKHQAHMADPTFQTAAVAALQAFEHFETEHSKDPAASFHKFAGAREFLFHLMNLSEVPIPMKQKEPSGLNYRV